MSIKNGGRIFFQGLLVLVAFIVSSCTSEGLTEETGRQEAATLRLTFKVADDAVTRALLDNDNENTVNDVRVLIFDSNKQLIGSKYVNNFSSTTGTTVTTRAATGCTVYAIANMGDDTSFAGINTIDELNTVSTATLSGAAALGEGNSAVMEGSTSTPINITEGTNSIEIPIKHLCSKINISIVPSSGITITGYQLCHAALGSYITDSHSSAGTAVAAPVSSGDSYGNFDAVTLDSPTAGKTVTSPVYYVYENLAGSSSSTLSSSQERTEANAPTDAMYLKVYAKTSVSHSIYYIYLGGMKADASGPEYSNFNIYRNMNYTYTVNINGFGEDDTRVTCIIDVPPSIGDIYYNDGTWGSTLDESKTPVGIIFSTTTSTTDYSNGYTHGYVMALKNAASGVAWCSSSAAYYKAQLQTTLTNTVALEESNWDGLTETNAIRGVNDYNQTNYPACYYAVNYSAALPSSGTSGWYLPSMGQWYLIVKNLGGVTTAPLPSNADTPNYGLWEEGTSFSTADAMNTYLNKAGSSNVDTIDCSSSASRMYWCSSEYSRDLATFVLFDSYGYLILNCPRKTYYTGVRVRPVVAF